MYCSIHRRASFIALLIFSVACGPGPSAERGENGIRERSPSPQTMRDAAAFSIYSGNESLPPQYQDVTRIAGSFDDAAKRVAVHYARTKEEKDSTRDVDLQGADFERLRQIVRATSLVEDSASRGVGGGAFVVTLKEAGGRSIYGTPSNEAEWRSVIEMIERAPAPPPQSSLPPRSP